MTKKTPITTTNDTHNPAAAETDPMDGPGDLGPHGVDELTRAAFAHAADVFVEMWEAHHA